MFFIDDKDTKRLERDLERLKKRAFPFAVRETLNRAAFKAQKEYHKEATKDLVLRNKFTTQSIRVKQAKGLNVRQLMSVVGSTAPYMEKQEFGGTVTKQGKEGQPIATSYSSGDGENAQPRTHLPRKPNLRRNITLKSGKRKAKNQKQALLFKVQDAVTSGDKVFYHKFSNGTKGLFKVVGGRKKFRRGWPPGAKIKMLWDLTHLSITVPREPMLAPAHMKAAAMLPRFYRDSLRFQINRHNMFKS